MPEAKPLSAIEQSAPDWVVVRSVDDADILVDATVQRASGAKGRLYKLKIYEDSQGFVFVREDKTENIPLNCPTRHLNGDGSFCLGYQAGHHVSDPKVANDWWKKLRVFLLCQETASGSGCWPKNAQLSHGAAGPIQLKQEAVADELGKRDDLLAAYQGEGWIEDNIWLVTDKGERLVNGRSPCLCGRKDKKGRLVLRRECHRIEDGCLLVLEAKRRDAERKFLGGYRGKKCCGTMKECPLNPDWVPKIDRRVKRMRARRVA